MALNKLKKWIGTQAMTAFFDQLNDNVDATNAAIDLAEQNAADISSLPIGLISYQAHNSSSTEQVFELSNYSFYLFFAHAIATNNISCFAMISTANGNAYITEVRTSNNLDIAFNGTTMTVTPSSRTFRMVLWRLKLS